MARKMYRRLTQAVYGPDGRVVHESGDVVAADAPLDVSALYTEFEVDEPDPEPGPASPSGPSSEGEKEEAAPPKRKSATVKAQAAEGAGGAHP